MDKLRNFSFLNRGYRTLKPKVYTYVPICNAVNNRSAIVQQKDMINTVQHPRQCTLRCGRTVERNANV